MNFIFTYDGRDGSATIRVYLGENPNDELSTIHHLIPSEIEKIIGNRRYLSTQEIEMLIAIDYFGEKYRLNKGR